MKKTLLLCLTALLVFSLAAPAFANELNFARLCPVADEFTVVCPAGWRTGDSPNTQTSSGNYVWLYILWNEDTYININKEDMRRKYKDVSFSGMSRRLMDEAYREYLHTRPGKGKYKSTYVDLIYTQNEDFIPFIISRCVGTEYAANPKDNRQYYYYEAFTIINGWRIYLEAQSSTQNPKFDVGEADLAALKDIVITFALM